MININALLPLTENIYWVKAPGKGRFPYCNGFLLTGEPNILIDAGIGKELIKEIDKQFRIDCLIISHSHSDHIMFWYELADRIIIMPQETPDDITDLTRLGQRFTGNQESALYWKNSITHNYGFKPMRLPDKRYSNGDLIGNDRVKLRAIHAPGHIDDHYCFFHTESGLLLTTDIDLTRFGPWYGNPVSSITLFKKSIQMVQSLPYQMVCSSHHPPILDKESAKKAISDFIGYFEVQKKIVLEMCSTPQTLQQLIEQSPFYYNKMPDKTLQAIFETPMIQKNLDLLLEEELICKQNGQFYETQEKVIVTGSNT